MVQEKSRDKQQDIEMSRSSRVRAPKPLQDSFDCNS